MAKNKRTHSKPPPAPHKRNSKIQHERCYAVAKKMLKHYGYDPNLIDTFTKKQKQALFAVAFDSPIVRPDKEKTVPRQYVDIIHAAMYRYMKTHFYGNPENNLTYMEVYTYGVSFMLSVTDLCRTPLFMQGTPQAELAIKLGEIYMADTAIEDGIEDILDQIWYYTKSYSKMNFRFYGFIYEHEDKAFIRGVPTMMKMTIRLTAQNAESKKFVNKDIVRKAFRVLVPADGNRIFKSEYVTVPRNRIVPKATDTTPLNIYIQSHVLHRMKERLDALPPQMQNLLIQFAFTKGLSLVPHGNKILFPCMIKDGNPVGYFTYFIHEDDIVINTFLPITSIDTPEGKKLYELLKITKEENAYLGMDRISFFLKVDFEQIPALKQALIESKIWNMKIALENVLIKTGRRYDEKKTMFVKNFFEKRELHRAEML